MPEGSQGAGAGATVGKVLGPQAAMKAGQGACTVRTRDGLAVCDVAVVNAVGSVVGADGRVLAGPCLPGGEPMDAAEILAAGGIPGMGPGEATTICAVVAGAKLDKAQLLRVGYMAHDGLARAISPSHALWDGDTIFTAAVGERVEDPTRVGALAALAVAEAIRRSVTVASANAPASR